MAVINLFGGPGSGKSTTAAGVFAELKNRGVNCELVTEVAKDIVWDGATRNLSNQLYVLGNQSMRILRLVGQVDVAVTDSPIMLSVVYNRIGQTPIPGLDDAALFVHNRFENLNFLLERVKPYTKVGRYQDREEAVQIDAMIETVLASHRIPFLKAPGNRHGIAVIADAVHELARTRGKSR